MKKLLTSIIVVLLSIAVNGQTSMVDGTYSPFNVGEIKPEGWLRDWAGLAARGMTRKMGEDFTEFKRGWADPTQGGWWHYEQTAYYTDGFTRLGFLLDDTLLINRSRRVMEAVVARQKPNGYIHSNNKDYVSSWGTTNVDYGLYWSEGVFCRAALAYYSATGDQRVLEMLKRVYHDFPLFSYDTSKGKPFNGGDLDNMRKLCGLENMFELTRYTGDPYFADRALQVLRNYESAYINTWVKEKYFLRTAMCHGVTYNEASKLPAIGYMWGGNPDYLAASRNSYEFVQDNTVLPNGCNSSNEFFHGIGAFEACESCDVTDFMWSNIWMARATGDRCYGDRIERDFFNALPGAVNSTFTQCLYTQAPNRIPGFHLKIRDDGNYYKEMHWPTCCPANLNRALPNYIINMAMQGTDGSLLWLTYGPAHLKTADGNYDVVCETQYPFRDKIILHINALPAGKTLRLRIPEWCDEPSYMTSLNPSQVSVEDGYFVIREAQRSKSKKSKTANDKAKGSTLNGTTIELTFPMKPELVTSNETFPLYKGNKAPSWGMMAGTDYEHGLDGFYDAGRYGYVSYGPLLFGMSMQERPGDYFDINEELWHEFRYALCPQSLDGCKVEFKDMPRSFSWRLDNAPISISAKAHLVDWNPDKGDPVMPTEEPSVIQRDISIKLLPYGFMAYRIAMFPWVSK
ncbi:MAG: glycoside hydrolase family 127 protein [Bacteroidaceae bacterium]|nr:glycoside hydrolase family 127 protein [Bacteroidaceae bacterium]